MKLSKKLAALGIVCVMTIGQCVSAFGAVSYIVYQPETDKVISADNTTYYRYVTGKVYINTLSFLKIGYWMNYSSRGYGSYSTTKTYAISNTSTNSFTHTLIAASGLVSDGRTYKTAMTEGYYGSSKATATNYMGYQYKVL